MPKQVVRFSHWFLGLALSLSVLVSSCPARAFNYSEHHDAVCVAVAATCAQLVNVPPGEDAEHAARRTLALGMLCNNSCGNLPAGTVQVTDQHTLFEKGCQTKDFGDAVALIDYWPGRTIRRVSCGWIDVAKKNIVHAGIAALIADDHFCPNAPVAYTEDHRAARAIALSASEEKTDNVYDTFRVALFQEAEALHYYTDNFAAGHQMARLKDGNDPFVTKSIHDYYNAVGRQYATKHDRTFVMAYGDGHLEATEKALMAAAVARSLGDVVQSFVEATLQDHHPEDYAPVCPGQNDPNEPPGLEEEVPLHLRHHSGELRAGFYDIMQVTTGDEVIAGRTVAFEVEYALPVLPALNLAAKAEIASWKRGVTLAELNAGVRRTYRGRDIGLVPLTVEFVPVLWRTFRLVGTVAPLRISMVDLVSPKPGYFRVGSWYDGVDTSLGVEAAVLLVAIRASLMLDAHRSLHSDDLVFGYGAVFSGAYRW